MIRTIRTRGEKKGLEETGGNWLRQPPSNLCKLYWSPYPFFCAALRKQPRHNVDVKPLFVAAGPLFPPTKKRLLGQLKSIFTWESHPSNDTIILQFDVQHGLGLCPPRIWTSGSESLVLAGPHPSS